jgi:hypothetical protein
MGRIVVFVKDRCRFCHIVLGVLSEATRDVLRDLAAFR